MKIVHTDTEINETSIELNGDFFSIVADDAEIGTEIEVQNLNTAEKEVCAELLPHLFPEILERKRFEAKKASMLQELGERFNQEKERPRVETTLGFSVDGGREDLQNFEKGRKYALPLVKDADGNTHSVTTENYDTIIESIELHGLNLYQRKWGKEAEIENCTTVEELEAIKL